MKISVGAGTGAEAEAQAGTVEAMLRERIGLDAASLTPGSVERAVRSRTSACGCATWEEYVVRLSADAREFDELVEGVVVPETWFFRDGGPFEALSRLVGSGGSPARGAGPLQVLSMPCATGEEAWSIAMVLASRGHSPATAHVDAVDVSRRSLASAERGVYGPSSFRGGEADAWRRCFRSVPGGMEVDPSLRALVRWSPGNALEWGGPSPSARYDAIFCRNLIIYLGAGARRKVLSRLDALLLPGGLLFLGHAEPPRSFFPDWETVDVPRSFAARKPLSPALAPSAPADAPPPARVAAAAAAPRRPASAPATGRVRTHPPRPPETALAPLPRAPLVVAPKPAAVLERARRFADRGELEAARSSCEEALRLDPASHEARYLLGVVAHARGDDRAAETELTRALYLDPGNVPALVQLALILEAGGRAEEAVLVRRRAERRGKAS